MADAPEPITLAQAKAHLRLDTDDEDDLVGSLIIAAREHVEDYTGLVLTPRVITETAATLGRWLDLSSWPVTAVSAVRYSSGGVMTALDVSAYVSSLKRRPVRILPTSWGWGVGAGQVAPLGCPQLSLPVEIDVAAGFATPDDVPAAVKQAMLLLVGHFYSNRREVETGIRAVAVEIPLGVAALLRRWRLRTL